MTCIKCGIEIPEGQVFCDHCLSVMEQYPIKPDAHIHLPKRSTEAAPERKPARVKSLSPEEQIEALKLKVLRTRLIAVILTFLLCTSLAFLGLKVYQDYTDSQTGRNYTIDTSMND